MMELMSVVEVVVAVVMVNVVVVVVVMVNVVVLVSVVDVAVVVNVVDMAVVNRVVVVVVLDMVVVNVVVLVVNVVVVVAVATVGNSRGCVMVLSRRWLWKSRFNIRESIPWKKTPTCRLRPALRIKPRRVMVSSVIPKTSIA